MQNSSSPLRFPRPTLPSQIYDFNEKGQHYKLVGYLRQSWNDPRLAWTADGQHCWGDQISVPPEKYKNIWRPDIFFSNSLSEHFGTAPRPPARRRQRHPPPVAGSSAAGR